MAFNGVKRPSDKVSAISPVHSNAAEKYIVVHRDFAPAAAMIDG